MRWTIRFPPFEPEHLRDSLGVEECTKLRLLQTCLKESLERLEHNTCSHRENRFVIPNAPIRSIALLPHRC